MAKPTTVLDELNESSLFLSSLYGVRTVFERELGIKNMLIATDEMIKARIDQRVKQNQLPEFPYAYLVLNEVQAVKELQPNKVVKRLGYRMGTTDASRATSSKGYIFPVKASLELKYTDSDPLRVIKVAEALMILGQIGALFFELRVGDDVEAMQLSVRMEIPESVSIPLADTGNTTAPGAMEVSLSFVMNAYAGFFRDVSAVNSTSPIVTTTIVDEINHAL